MGSSLIPAYDGPVHLGVPGTEDIFKGTCYVQEKVDGSQISFGLVADPLSPGSPASLHIRSKGTAIDQASPGKLFAPAVATILDLYRKGLLDPAYIYRGESIAAPRHNVLAYDRIPRGGVILYDIEVPARGEFLNQTLLEYEAARLGLETVPVIEVLHDRALFPDDGYIQKAPSCLGGSREGVVLKNYGRRIFAKYVSIGFKEVAQQVHGPNDTGKARAHFDIAVMASNFRTHARWNKAIQHLREDGKLTNTPKDIGPLVREIQADVRREEEDTIKQLLFDKFWPEFNRACVHEFHAYYKMILAGGNPMQTTEPSLTTQVLEEWKQNGGKDASQVRADEGLDTDLQRQEVLASQA